MKPTVDTKLAAAAVAVALGLAAGAATAHAAGEKEKCYGIAKQGHNDCAAGPSSCASLAQHTSGHSCAGKAVADNLPAEWVFTPKGACAKEGGKTTPPAK